MDSKERIEKALLVANDTKGVELGQGVIAGTPELFNRFFSGRKAVVIADKNTWRAAGERVYNILKGAGIEVSKYIIEAEEFHAEWRYVEAIDKVLDGDLAAAKNIELSADYAEGDASGAYRSENSEYPVAVSVGSGTINDLCKLCSAHHRQSYLSIPTAASVDGYSSFGASITYHNAKQTFECPAPVAILADVDIIADAPKEMTAAGYADLAAKIPAGAEWMIADLFGTEPIIPEAWHMLQDVLDEQLSDPEGAARGDKKAVSDLFEGLMLSGFAMQAARSSRPASCCDHLFSHILDMTHHRYKGKYQSHGFQVAIGTLTMCAVFDELLKYDIAGIDVDACVEAWPSLEEEQERALKLFKDFPSPRLGYEQITMKYSDADTVRKQLETIKSVWPEFSEKIREQVYSFEKMQRLFRLAGAPYEPSMIGLSRQKVLDMFPIVQMMRWRFNVLDFAKRAGIYDTLVESVFREGGAWDLAGEH